MMKKIFKNKIMLLIILGISCVIGLIFTFGGHAFVEATSNDKFCTLCHDWMDPMVEGYSQDVHGGNNAHGTKASCAACHLPHDNLAKYLLVKGRNGVVELSIMMTHDAKDMDWQKNRKNRNSFVYDSGCMSCHIDIETTKKQSDVARQMHEKYTTFKDAIENPLMCVSCHKNVGHKNLSKILYDKTHEPIGEWDADKKLDLNKKTK